MESPAKIQIKHEKFTCPRCGHLNPTRPFYGWNEGFPGPSWTQMQSFGCNSCGWDENPSDVTTCEELKEKYKK